jgi:hypothetical protein
MSQMGQGRSKRYEQPESVISLLPDVALGQSLCRISATCVRLREPIQNSLDGLSLAIVLDHGIDVSVSGTL